MQSNDNTATNEMLVNCVLLPGSCTDQLHIHESVIIITSNILCGEPEPTLYIYLRSQFCQSDIRPQDQVHCTHQADSITYFTLPTV